METRILIALTLIVSMLFIGSIWGVGALRRRHRQRLRKRGIKTYGH